MARIYEMRIHQCKDNGTECTGGGTKNTLTPRKNKLLDYIVPHKNSAILLTLFMKGESAKNIKIQQFHPRNSMASFNSLTFFHIQKYNQSDPWVLLSRGLSFLPSCWSLRLCRLPFCQTQASFYRFFFEHGNEHR